MLKVSRIAILLLMTLVFAIYAPEQARRLLVERHVSPFIQYSSPLKTFFISAWDPVDQRRRITDLAGNEYSQTTYEKALPMFFFRDLATWGCLPESIDGVEVTLKKVARNRQFVRLSPKDLNSPVVPLYPLYESASGFTRLKNPADMFRITESLEFIDTESNKVVTDKSERFTRALQDQGFTFPARRIFGNPTPMKPFDEGYFITDAKGALFHLKLVKGTPLVKNTGLAPASGIRYIGVEEDSRREFYGLMVEGDGRASLLSCDTYTPIDLPIKGYDPDSMSLTINCDLLKRTFVMKDKKTIRVWVTDRDYHLVAKHVHALEGKKGGKILKRLFPLRVIRAKAETHFALLDFSWSPQGWMASLFSLAVLLGWRLKKREVMRHPEDLVLVLLTGACGLLAVVLAGSCEMSKS
ncbi:DUF4857 domain-containing protein [Desulfoluna sp.]|uniref:DUF4857 domain-containing protein n=1 Tax=Desulfoluna sp. TaxID=2045199 RepID=UPI00262EB1D6|nr:DUF4857 domain-containing protein [Desulfoluna sp.]